VRTLKATTLGNASLSGFFLACLALAGVCAAHLVACENTTAGAGNAFVGTWSCPTLPAGARSIVISQNLDTSLNLSPVGDGGAGPFCATDEWTYSGSTVSMENGTSCLGGATGTEVIVVNNFSLTVNGNSLTVVGNETLSSGGEEPDGMPTATFTKQTLSLSGTCTKE
jgi:hypothetical protein